MTAMLILDRATLGIPKKKTVFFASGNDFQINQIALYSISVQFSNCIFLSFCCKYIKFDFFKLSRGNDEKSKSQRMHIYVSLLKQMAPEQLLATFSKVSSEILVAPCEGMLKIEDITSQSVLQDTFRVLYCKEMKIPTNKGSSLESSEMEEESAENADLSWNALESFLKITKAILMRCSLLINNYKKNLLTTCKSTKPSRQKSTSAEAVSKGKGICENHLNTSSKVSSAMAGARAEVTAKSVLRDVTPTLSAMNVPKLKSASGYKGNKSAAVLESLCRRQIFDSDDES
ncbi:condensin-2 complex subunit D3 [Tanacetum coccineum]